MSTAVATKEASPVVAFTKFMDRVKPQMALALPKHMNPDRMARLAVTAFSSNPTLQECTPQSIAGAVLTAAQLGLEPHVNGACFLVPYNAKQGNEWVKKAQLIPGWKGLVDLVSRTGRASAWTGAVYSDDIEFDYALGDNPFVRHKPGEQEGELTHVYAIGRVNGSQWPIVEVWPITKVWKHRDRVIGKLPEWQQAKHYSHRDPEMYARKVPLLQALKYLPSSVELSNAIALNDAHETGQFATLDGDFVTVTQDERDESRPEQARPEPTAPPAMSAEEFEAKKEGWNAVVLSGRKTAAALIATIESKTPLSDEQKKEIAAWEVKS